MKNGDKGRVGDETKNQKKNKSKETKCGQFLLSCCDFPMEKELREQEHQECNRGH